MKVNLYLLLFIVLTGSKPVYSQSPKIIPPSPEASALAKMVNYPVSLNTGVPSISIPLYQVETGGMVLPIALDYHAGGFKINERSTSVGLGWNLTTDIQIIRSVNGLDDFEPGQGYIGNTLMKAHSDACSTCDYPLITYSPYANNAYYIAAGAADGAPDKFNYKLLNKSGSFYFQKNTAGTGYTIVPVPYDNIKITYDFGEFTIVDTDGTTYVFGSKGTGDINSIAARAVELTGSLKTGWKVKKVVNSTQTDSIKFTYQTKAVRTIYNNPESIEYYKNDPCELTNPYRSDQNPTITTYEDLLNLHPFFNLSSPKYMVNVAGRASVFHMPYVNAQNQVIDKSFTANQALNLTTMTVWGLALDKIEFRGGSVVFSGADKLSSIVIRDAVNAEVRSFNFFQSYKNATYADDAKAANGQDFIGTMYLDSIQVKNNNQAYETYGLMYKEKFCFGAHLKGQDAWGYPNASTTEFAASSDQIAVPEQKFIEKYYRSCVDVVNNVPVNVGNPDNTESPDREAAQRGILRAIIYPTGGYVNFDFESNKYSSPTSGENSSIVRMGGGLRIRAINYFDGKSLMPVSQKYYRYGELEDGTGLLINSPSRDYDDVLYKFGAFSYSQTTVYLGSTLIDCYNRSCLSIWAKETKTTYLPASSSDYTYSNGAPIYYTKVTEYNNDLGTLSGKKVHTFYGPAEFDNTYLSYPDSKVEGTNINRMRSDGLIGAEKLVEDYKYENNKFVLEHSKEFVYTKYSRPEKVKVAYAFFNNIYKVISGPFNADPSALYNTSYEFGSGTSDFDMKIGQYGIEVGKLLLSTEIETWIKGTETFNQTTAYNYGNSQYLQPTSIVTTNSKGEQLTKSLKYSYDFSGQSVYSQMQAKNMIDQVVEETVYHNSLNKEISRTKTNYAFVTTGAGFYAPRNVIKSTAGHTPDTLITYDLYDAQANILQVTEKNAYVKSYLWGYDGKYPIAEISGLSYADATSGVNVPALQATTDEVTLRTALTNLRTGLPNALVKTFTFKPLVGITSQSSPTGLNNFYQYDGFGRLSVIRDHNNHILKKIDYKMIGTASSLGNSLSYVNVPSMGTYFKVCNDLSIQTSNIIYQGGLLSTTSKSNLDNLTAIGLESQGNYYSFEEGCDISPNTTDYVKINLQSYFLSERPLPNDINIDLIKDGMIVASHKFSELTTLSALYTGPEISFYVPAGQYQVSLRQDNNFSGSVLNYTMAPSSGSPFLIKTGNSLTLAAGVNYVLTVKNVPN